MGNFQRQWVRGGLSLIFKKVIFQFTGPDLC